MNWQEIDEPLLNYQMVHKEKCHLIQQINFHSVLSIGKPMIHIIVFTSKVHQRSCGFSATICWLKVEINQLMNKSLKNSNKSIWHSVRVEKEYLDLLNYTCQEQNSQKEPNSTWTLLIHLISEWKVSHSWDWFHWLIHQRTPYLSQYKSVSLLVLRSLWSQEINLPLQEPLPNKLVLLLEKQWMIFWMKIHQCLMKKHSD